MDIKEIKEYMKNNKITYDKLANMTGLSISTITKIFGGFAKYPRVDTMNAIENALGLNNNNRYENTHFNNSLKDRPDYEVMFAKNFGDLMNNKEFNDLAKLYKVMNDIQRGIVLGFAINYLQNAGVNTQIILNG